MSYFAIGGNSSANGSDTRLRSVSPHQECVSSRASMGLPSRPARMRPDRRSTSRLRIVARLSTSARDSARSVRTIGLPCVSSAWALVKEPWRLGGIPGHCGRRGQRGQAGRRGQRHRHQRIACESSGNPRASRSIRGWEVTPDEGRRHACRKSRHQTSPG